MGDLVKFGNYEWYIADRSSDSCTLLLCTDDIVEPYNDQRADVTWETCSLRTYLNDSFYNEFNTKEKEAIIKKECVNKGNERTGISGGNNTEDYVYILSYDEAENLDSILLNYDYFGWLRTSGENSYEALYRARTSYFSEFVHKKKFVHPVITIDLSK